MHVKHFHVQVERANSEAVTAHFNIFQVFKHVYKAWLNGLLLVFQGIIGHQRERSGGALAVSRAC
jgi:hypothetical protein